MKIKARFVWVNYLLTVLIVAVVSILTKLEWPWIKPEVTPLLLAGVMLSAWLGGLGPGLLATALSVAVVEYFTTPAGQTPALDLADLLRLAVFVLAASSISWLNAVRRRAEQFTRDAFLEAKNANVAKDNFLAVLSHELRNPLAPALLLSSARRDDASVPAELRGDFDTIYRSVHLQARLVDDLLDVTRIAHGKLPLRMEIVDVHQIISDAMFAVAHEAGEKRIDLRHELHARQHFVRGDSVRLSQVFLNLLRNAVKFTPTHGSVVVQTRNSVGGRMMIEVADTGIGIGRDVLPRIFDAFNQGGERVTRQFGGLGLGLTICKGLVAAHGGRVTASSDGKDLGSTFTVELPTAPAPTKKSSQPAAPLKSQGNGKRQLRILLVEDHADTANVLCRVLRQQGYAVRTAESVESTLKLASAEPFDLVISDLGLPDGSGLELMRELKRRFPVRGIALTGYGSEDDERRTKEAGFAAHLTKPVSVEELEETIRMIDGD